jgi:hypothetical protein
MAALRSLFGAVLALFGRLLIIVPTERAAWGIAALAPVALVIAATAPGAWVIAPVLGGVLLGLVVIDGLLSGRNAAWAIQTGPLLVEQGRSGINTSTSVAQRSVIALRRGQALVIRTGRIGLKELADGLVEAGIETAINLDGGPSSALQARIAGATADRPGTAKVPYFLGFLPKTP